MPPPRYSQVSLEDTLTHLGNRYLLTSRLADAIAHAKQAHSSVALLVLDIGRLRAINEELGFAWGDAVLRTQANAIKEVSEPQDTVVRLQGDQFAIIRPTRDRALSVAQYANALLARLTTPTVIQSSPVQYLQPSIGIALYPRDGLDSVSLLQAAEYAHSIAKNNGRSRFQFINLRQHERYHREALIENSLQEALEQGTGLSLRYQPQVCPSSGAIQAMEVLLRWQHPKLGIVSPAEFVPLAELSGQAVALDRWVIQQVCEQMAQWIAAGVALPAVSINLSAKQLEQPDFWVWLQDRISGHQLCPKQIKLEVTENTLMKTECAQVLDKLRSLGFRIALDDFGTGYSALASLHKFAFDELKIDRSFMVEACSSERALLLLKTVVHLAQQLSLSLVIEGVETQEQLDLLADFGPLTVQGYYFYKPLPVKELTQLLATKKISHRPVW